MEIRRKCILSLSSFHFNSQQHREAIRRSSYGLTDRFPAWRTRHGRIALDPTWTLMSAVVNGSKYGPVYNPPTKRLATRWDVPPSIDSSSSCGIGFTAIWMVPSWPIAELQAFPITHDTKSIAIIVIGSQALHCLWLFYIWNWNSRV